MIVIVIVIVSGDWAAICGRVALLLIPFVLVCGFVCWVEGFSVKI